MHRKTLLLAPTQNELQTLLNHSPAGMSVRKGPFRVHFLQFQGQDALAMVCGIGPALSAAATASAMQGFAINRVLLFGLAGSYVGHPPQTILQAHSDRFLDLGSRTAEGFVPLNRRMELLYEQTLPEVLPAIPLDSAVATVPMGTASRVCSSPQEAERIRQDFETVEVESMEGAAVATVAYLHEVDFCQIRCISNACGETNRENWSIQNALKALEKSLQQWI